jgi:hypothetical protein
MTGDDALRLRATRVRLMSAGFRFAEDKASGSGNYYIRIWHTSLGGTQTNGETYDEAERAALQWGSHTLARAERGPRLAGESVREIVRGIQKGDDQ